MQVAELTDKSFQRKHAEFYIQNLLTFQVIYIILHTLFVQSEVGNAFNILQIFN